MYVKYFTNMGERETIFSMIPKSSLGIHGDFKGKKITGFLRDKSLSQICNVVN